MSDETAETFAGKEATLAEIANERNALVRVVRQLTPEQMVAPLLDGDRSPKDLLAHLLHWEQHMVNKVRERALGAPPVPEETADLEGEDAENDYVFAKYSGWSLDDVYTASLESYNAAWALLNDLPEESWQLTFPSGTSLWDFILGNTAGHYREHRAQFAALVADAEEPAWPGKAAMLDQIAAARAALDGTVERLSAEQLAAPSLDGDRSPKDVLAHLLYWERHMGRNVRVAQGEDLPAVEFGDIADEDERNALVFAKYQDTPAADLLAERATQWATTWALLNDLPEAGWLQTRPGYGYPLWAHIEANTTEHYEEHAAQLAALLA